MKKNLQIISCIFIVIIFYCCPIQGQSNYYYNNIIFADLNFNPLTGYLFKDVMPRIGINYSRRINNFRIKKRNLYVNLGVYYNLSNETKINSETKIFEEVSNEMKLKIGSLFSLPEKGGEIIDEVFNKIEVNLKQKFVTLAGGLSYPILPIDPNLQHSSPWKLIVSADFMYHIPIDSNQYTITFQSTETIPANTLSDYEVTPENFGLIELGINYHFIINLGFAVEYQFKTSRATTKHAIGLKTNILLPSRFQLDTNQDPKTGESRFTTTGFWNINEGDENDNFEKNIENLWFPFINASLQYTFKF